MKKNFTEKDLMVLVDSEIIAYQVYDNIIRQKLSTEYVDVLAQTYSSIDIRKDHNIETFLRANEILKNDYEVNMMDLPFRSGELKNKINDAINYGYSKDKIDI